MLSVVHSPSALNTVKSHSPTIRSHTGSSLGSTSFKGLQLELSNWVKSQDMA